MSITASTAVVFLKRGKKTITAPVNSYRAFQWLCTS